MLPSSHCSPVSMVPFPQLALVHCPPLQTRPFAPHEVPSGGGAPFVHFWPLSPFGPVTELHVAVPAQTLLLMQLFGLVVHENLQSVSQPDPGRFLPAPKSHCSPLLTTPSPQ